MLASIRLSPYGLETLISDQCTEQDKSQFVDRVFATDPDDLDPYTKGLLNLFTSKAAWMSAECVVLVLQDLESHPFHH